MKRVFVIGCREDKEGVSHDDADHYTVLIDDDWAADFAYYTDAFNWAEEVADGHSLELEDMTFEKEEVN